MLGFLCGLYTIGQLIKEAFEPKLPAEYHGNSKLEEADINKVRFGQMSRGEFNRNMNNGKYYAPINRGSALTYTERAKLEAEMWKRRANDRFNAIEFRDYLSGKAKGWMSEDSTWGEKGQYEFIKEMSREDAESLLQKFLEKFMTASENGTPRLFTATGWDVEDFLFQNGMGQCTNSHFNGG